MKENKPTDKPDGFSEFVQSFQTPDELQEGLNPVWCDIISEEITDPETIKKEVSSLKKTAEEYFKNHQELMKVCPDGSIKEALQPLADAREYLSGINPKTAGRHELINLLAFVVVSEGLNNFFIVTQVYEIRKDETSEPITNFARYAAKQLLNFNTEIKLTRYSVCADLCENDSLNRSFIGNLEEPIRIVRESHTGFSDALDMATNEELGKFLESVLLKQEIQNLTSVVYKKYAVAHDQITNALLDQKTETGAIGCGEFGIDARKENLKRGRKAVVIKTNIAMQDNPNNKALDRLTEEHYAILNEVYTQYLNNPNKPFTLSQITRGVNGMSHSEKPTGKQLKNTADKMNDMRMILIDLDLSELVKAKKLLTADGELIEDPVINDNLLPLTMGKGKVNGKPVSTYIFRCIPPLLYYGKLTGLVSIIDSEVKEVKHIERKKVIDQNGKARIKKVSGKRVSMTKNTRPIRNYLIRTIETMRGYDDTGRMNYQNYLNRKRRNPDLKEKTLKDFGAGYHKISYETILTQIGKPNPSADDRRKCRECVRLCLEYWKWCGHIKDYKEYKDGRKLAGMEISFQ